MENHHAITGPFSMAMLNNQMVLWITYDIMWVSLPWRWGTFKVSRMISINSIKIASYSARPCSLFIGWISNFDISISVFWLDKYQHLPGFDGQIHSFPALIPIFLVFDCQLLNLQSTVSLVFVFFCWCCWFLIVVFFERFHTLNSHHSDWSYNIIISPFNPLIVA